VNQPFGPSRYLEEGATEVREGEREGGREGGRVRLVASDVED